MLKGFGFRFRVVSIVRKISGIGFQPFYTPHLLDPHELVSWVNKIRKLAWILHTIFSNQPLGVSPGLWMSREPWLMQYPG